jgi:hypothetical protein
MKSITQTGEMLKKLFENSLLYKLKAECFHYVRRPRSRRKDKVVTFTEIEFFKYYSCRDISGTLSLENNGDLNDKKLLRLLLFIESEFADEITVLDFNKQKDQFIIRSRSKDNHMDYSEKLDINEFQEYCLINLGDKNPWSVNTHIYTFFVFIPFIELYKFYLRFQWTDNEFTIKKVISSRFDLKEDCFDRKYKANNPKFLFKGVERTFENVFTLPQRIYEPPSQEEINEAPTQIQLYLKKILRHNVNNDKENNHVEDISSSRVNLNNDFAKNQGQLEMQGKPSPQ